MKNKMIVNIFLSIKLFLILLGVWFLFKLISHFMRLLLILIDLLKTIEYTPEIKIIIILASLYVTCSIISVIVNFIYKLYDIADEKYFKKDERIHNPKDK